jgi:hypothetical protein
MIPESYVGHEIALYQAVKFPMHWEKRRVLKSDYVAVDSTRFEMSGKTWLITQQINGEHENLRLFSFAELKGNGYLISQNDTNKRPGGKIFSWKSKLIRPAQDCTESYGGALNFYEIKEIAENRYEETLLLKIRPEDIVFERKIKPQGIHTYNFSSHYEVIDFKGYEFDIWFYILRPFLYIIRRVKRGIGI